MSIEVCSEKKMEQTTKLVFPPYYLFLFTFLSLTCLCLTSDATSRTDLITDICSKTLNATYCTDYLKPSYNSGKSLFDLAKDATQSSTTFLYLVYDEIHVREKQTLHDPVLHKMYNQCGSQYTEAVSALIQWQNLLISGDYKKLPSLASLALKQTQNCDANFAPPETEPAEFKSLNQQSVYICSIILALSDHLVAGKN